MKASTLKSAVLVSLAGAALFSTSVSVDTTGEFNRSKDLQALETSIPEYPRSAEMSGVEGYTIVEFTVMPDGTVVAPSIAESSYRLFSRAALAAISDWKLEPVVAELGVAIPVRTSINFSFVGLE